MNNILLMKFHVIGLNKQSYFCHCCDKKKKKKKRMENKEKKGIENHFATYQLKIYFPFTL